MNQDLFTEHLITAVHDGFVDVVNILITHYDGPHIAKKVYQELVAFCVKNDRPATLALLLETGKLG